MASHWLFAITLAALIGLVSVGTIRSARLLREWTPPFNPLLSPADNAVRLGLCAVCFVLGAALGPDLPALGWTIDRLATDLVAGVVAGAALAAALIGVGQWAVRRWGEGTYAPTLIQHILPINRREWAGVMVALLPAALVEELLFRSLPLGGLGWLAPPSVLLWPLALAFGLLHWTQGSWGLIGTTLAGIAFSWLFLATGSLWTPLAAHYVVNVLQVVTAAQTGLRPIRGV
jgi:membrane protease YdiL (CAAX protease family)